MRTDSAAPQLLDDMSRALTGLRSEMLGAETLALELTGVGPTLAEAIVREREQNGAFLSADDLMRVRGIGERIVEMNRENILVDGASE